MSERDVLKRFWLQVASGVLILILSGIGVIWTTKSETVHNAEQINQLKSERIEFVKKDENDRMFKVLIDNCEKMEERILKVEDETTENYKEIINYLFEIKREIQELSKQK